jgi:hypothetical protein
MTRASALLDRVRALGVTLRAEAGQVRFRPANAVPAALLAEMKALKAEILAELAANDAGTTHAARPQASRPEPVAAAPPLSAADAAVLAAIVAERTTDAEVTRLFDAWARSCVRKRVAYDWLDDAYDHRFSGTRPAEIYQLLDAAYAVKGRATTATSRAAA